MKVLSLFDGMSCGRIALERAGIPVNKYYASEIDKYCIKVTQTNYPDTIQLGDIKNWFKWDIPWYDIDLILAGSPCTGFSFSGKQLAFNDPKSKLFFEFVEILNHVKLLNPKVYFLLENVVMKKEYEKTITNFLQVEPVLINSSLVSAQNRKRLYWANFPITQPKDKGITWGNVRERNLNKYYYSAKALQWLAKQSQLKNKTLNVWLDEEKTQMLEASQYKGYSNQRFFGICDFPNDQECIAAMRGRYLKNGKRQDGKMKTKGLTQQYIEFRYDEKSNALTTVTKDNNVFPFTLPGRIPKDEFFFRYLSPIECERLQTIQDDYSSSVSKTQRYKMLGNAWTVDVIAHILKGLK